MNNTKLITLLKSFSRQEIVKFKDFVNSPFYNKNANVIRLAGLVLGHYPDFDEQKLNEAGIFSKMFPGEEFDYFKIKNISSDLYQLGINFLKTVANNKRAIENEIILLNELHERKLDSLYVQKEKQVKKLLSDVNIKDEFYHLARYQLAKTNTSHFKFKGSEYSFDLIQEEFDVFLNYSLMSFLRHYSKMLTNSNHGNVNFKLDMFDNVWDFVKSRDFENNLQCNIYRQIISLELSREEKDYRKIIELKNRYKDLLSSEDIFYILLVMNSYCAYRLKQGDEQFYNERFNAFREMIERKILTPDNTLFMNFISIYTSACMAGDYKWAQEYLKSFSKGITPKEETENTLNYCRGFFEYRNKNFDTALVYFSKTNFKLFLMKVMVKSYSLRIFYEQNLFEQAFTAIDSFRHYLKCEKYITEDQKSAHYEFLKNVGELTRLKLNKAKKNNAELNFLKKQVRNMKSNPLGAKNWLIMKTNEFG